MTINGKARIVIIGMGPRGISLFERIALAAERDAKFHAELFIIDAVQVGAGRIWRTDQGATFLMNTVVSQVTMFSGPEDGPVSRPGAGPTLQAWLKRQCQGEVEWHDNTYASRAAYGSYLQHCYQAFKSGMPTTIDVVEIKDEVVAVERGRDKITVRLAKQQAIGGVDAVILATGHARPDSLAQPFASSLVHQSMPTRCLAADSAADQPLHSIAPGEVVGVVGMGLGFYDIVTALTEGRGGSFREADDGLEYIPSGLEPKLVAGSRSGLPVLARAINQKTGHVSGEAFMTEGALRLARTRAFAKRGSHGLDFNTDVMPLLQAEMEHNYFAAAVRSRHGSATSELFRTEHIRLRRVGEPLPASLLKTFGLDAERPFDLRRRARPFEGRSFERHDAFTDALVAHLRWDIEEARRGNLTSPTKAAYDTLRDVRDTIRLAVEGFGLTAETRPAFLDDFVPVCSLLSAGPPIRRLRELLALMKAGIVQIAGPGAAFSETDSDGRLQVTSKSSPSFRSTIDYLLDSRIPAPSCEGDKSRLFAQLRACGALRPYRHQAASSRREGVDVSIGGRVIGVSGKVTPGLFILGIPTEGARWFTQVGSATPGTVSRFTKDATAVAEAVFSYCVALAEASNVLELVS